MRNQETSTEYRTEQLIERSSYEWEQLTHSPITATDVELFRTSPSEFAVAQKDEQISDYVIDHIFSKYSIQVLTDSYPEVLQNDELPTHFRRSCRRVYDAFVEDIVKFWLVDDAIEPGHASLENGRIRLILDDSLTHDTVKVEYLTDIRRLSPTTRKEEEMVTTLIQKAEECNEYVFELHTTIDPYVQYPTPNNTT